MEDKARDLEDEMMARAALQGCGQVWFLFDAQETSALVGNGDKH